MAFAIRHGSGANNDGKGVCGVIAKLEGVLRESGLVTL